jgi:excisionase family DNA binding protein
MEKEITVREAAEMLGVTRQNIYLHIKNGFLPVTRRHPFLIHREALSLFQPRPAGRPKKGGGDNEVQTTGQDACGKGASGE